MDVTVNKFELPSEQQIRQQAQQNGVVLLADGALGSIEHFLRQVVEEAAAYPRYMRMFFIFNGTPVPVHTTSTTADLFDKWVLTRKLHQNGIEIPLP